jgi:hypothetical protein
MSQTVIIFISLPYLWQELITLSSDFVSVNFFRYNLPIFKPVSSHICNCSFTYKHLTLALNLSAFIPHLICSAPMIQKLSIINWKLKIAFTWRHSFVLTSCKMLPQQNWITSEYLSLWCRSVYPTTVGNLRRMSSSPGPRFDLRIILPVLKSSVVRKFDFLTRDLLQYFKTNNKTKRKWGAVRKHRFLQWGSKLNLGLRRSPGSARSSF